MTCPASGTDQFAGNGLLTPPDEPDARYASGRCWSCWAREVPLVTVDEKLGLPGTRQVLATHEMVELQTWRLWRCHAEWWTCDAMGHDGGNECPACGKVGELIEEVRHP